jgi:MoaA/NifB/PqqE/SkfB family radical SAM enzyme
MTYINPRTKLLHHLERLVELRAEGRTRAPVNVEIDLSNRCSHGCDWCHFAHTHTRGPLASREKPAGMLDCGDQMDVNMIIRILGDLTLAGVKSITWSGGGEPTLHPMFNHIVVGASTTGMDQGIYTNGGHIDATRAALLKQHMTFVYVSLDECTPGDFLVSKGVNRWGHVISGIKELVAAPGPATTGVGFLLHANNYRQIYHMVELGKDLGVDYVQFRPIVNYDQDQPGVRVESAVWIDEAIQLLRQYDGDSFVQADPERFAMYRDWEGHGYHTCNWAALQTVITPNGQVWRCTNKRGIPDGLLGDLTQDSFASIWQRAGGTCQVNDRCRVLCRGHLANLTLDAIMTEPAHANFI